MHSVCSKYFPLSRRYLFYRQQCTTFSMPRYPFWWGCDLSLQTTLAFPQRWTQIFIFPLTENSYFWFQVNLCMVDIDNDRITIPEDLPTFPQHKELADELREVLTKLQQAPTVPTNSTINSSSSYYYFQNFFPSSINLTYVFFVTGISLGHTRDSCRVFWKVKCSLASLMPKFWPIMANTVTRFACWMLVSNF